MTIPEACQLVFEAAIMGNGGEIFVFDMGEPVRIYDLAEKMIRLSGFIPNEEIKILPDVAGRITAIAFKEGATVQQGQILVKLYNDDIKATLQKLKSQRELQLRTKERQDELLKIVNQLNNDDNVDGMLVQLPLPKHINATKVTEAILPHKDVDGFHPYNTGQMLKGVDTLLPATPYGIILMLEHYNIPTVGKHCVVIGRSDIVGKPMVALMSRNAYPGNCTVTMCHSKTVDLKSYTLQADILIDRKSVV